MKGGIIKKAKKECNYEEVHQKKEVKMVVNRNI